ncbi:MAG: sigma-70 family RNA polymerase sigma factor [Acidimicrobiales bacterium]|jgi:RNA polymerase sigma factor (sigma-70 family)
MAESAGHRTDSGGFEPWFRSEYRQVLGSMILAFGDRDLAEDATQDAFAKAYERWDRVAQMERRGAWVFVVAMNSARRRLRRRSMEALLTRRVRVAEPVPESTGMELWDLVRALPTRERTAIVLRYVGDLSEKEVAKAMGISPGGAAKTLNKARGHIAKHLVPDSGVGNVG